MTYDSHKKYKRVGECNHCGRCCDLYCLYLKWIAKRDIKADETISSPADFMAECLIHDRPELPEYQIIYVGRGCKDFHLVLGVRLRNAVISGLKNNGLAKWLG